MTTPSGASFEYPTLFVPSDKQQPSSTSAPAGNSNTGKEEGSEDVYLSTFLQIQ